MNQITKVWLLTAWGTENIRDMDRDYLQYEVLWRSEVYADKGAAEQRKQQLKEIEDRLREELKTAYQRTHDEDAGSYYHYIEDPISRAMFDICMDRWWDVTQGIEDMMFPLKIRIEQKDLLGNTFNTKVT